MEDSMEQYLLHMDDLVAILWEVIAELLGIFALCAIDIVGLEEWWQTCDVEAQRSEFTTCCRRFG